MKSKTIAYLYFFIGGLNIIAQVISNTEMNQYTKPLLMPLLIYYVYYSSMGRVTIHRLLVVGALIFSWMGDLLLLYPDRNLNFLGGLGAFLVGQLFYTFALNKAVYQRLKFRIKPVLPILLYGTALLVTLIPQAGDMKVPVFIYALCILAMVSTARLREGWTSPESFSLGISGAAIFVLSDSLLALDKFAFEIPIASFWIMLTYISAQYLLVKGILSHPG